MSAPIRSAGDSDVERVLAAMPMMSALISPEDEMTWASSALRAKGLLHRRSVLIPEFVALVTAARQQGGVLDEFLSLPKSPRRRTPVNLEIRIRPLSQGILLVVASDGSEAGRIDAVRRDFVANVSHELKTPVGALSLLAEASALAADEPESVRRFAGRMIVEAARLTNLINDLIDLSKLEGGSVPPSALVELDTMVSEAVDAVRLKAAAADIVVVTGGASGLTVVGNLEQLTTALRNLLTNAIAYSPAGTRVAVGVRREDTLAVVTVTDQGIGIPEADLGRIFERFYRVDSARSRATGGTGLGLAIVKHVCANHGGDCSVWSMLGEGSTFTIRIPLSQKQNGELGFTDSRLATTGQDWSNAP
jgi:two-component system, OmpR family, sensor histidine kinase SenX3